MNHSRGLFDPNLQPERTLLAWRRTCLAFALVSLIAMRFTIEVAGVLAVFAGLVGAGLATAAYLAAATGYTRANNALHRTGHLNHDARPMALATLSVLLAGATCTIYIALSA